MDFIIDFWQPIVVSAVLVWVASGFMHMVLPFHKGEWSGLKDEGKLNDALDGMEPGQYMFPWGTNEDMKDPKFIEKIKKGPNGFITIWSGPTNMGRNLGLMLLFYIVVGVFVAYVVSRTLGSEIEYIPAFRIAGAIAFMSYGLGWIPNMIWFGGKGFWTYTLDALVYAILTAGTFGWLGQ